MHKSQTRPTVICKSRTVPNLLLLNLLIFRWGLCFGQRRGEGDSRALKRNVANNTRRFNIDLRAQNETNVEEKDFGVTDERNVKQT